MDMTLDESLRVLRVKIWDKGHTFEEIDGLNLEDLGDILASWNEQAAMDAKRERARKRKN